MPRSRKKLELCQVEGQSWYPLGLKIDIPLETGMRRCEKTTVKVFFFVVAFFYKLLPSNFFSIYDILM